MSLPQTTKTIPELTLGTTPLTGNELIEMSQAGTSVKIEAKAFPPIGAAYITLANNGFLIGSRTLIAGPGVSLTDGGAGSTVTISLTGAGGTGFGSGWDWSTDPNSLAFITPSGNNWGVMFDDGAGRNNIGWIAVDTGGGTNAQLALAGFGQAQLSATDTVEIDGTNGIVLNSLGGQISTNTNMTFDGGGGFTTTVFPGTVTIQQTSPVKSTSIQPGQVTAQDDTDATNAVQFIANNQNTGTNAITQHWIVNDIGTAIYLGVTGSNFGTNFLTGGPVGEAGFLTTSDSHILSIGANLTEFIRIDPNTGGGDITIHGQGVIINYNSGEGFTVSYTGGGGPTANLSMNEIGGADFNLSGDMTFEIGGVMNITLTGALELAGDPGSSGDVITSQGAGSPPIWANPVAPTAVQTTVLAAGNTSNLALSAGSKGFLDLNPTGGASTLTGIAAQFDGQILVVSNIHATNSVTLSALNGLSLAANQFRLSADLTLLQYGSLTLRYSTTIGKWVPLS